MFGCGVEELNYVSAPQPESPADKFKGKWVTDCLVIENVANKFVMQFSGSFVSTYMLFYEDLGCKNKYSVIQTKRSFRIVETSEGADKIDAILSSATMTPLSCDVAYFSNRDIAYGYNDWYESEPKSIERRPYSLESETWPIKGEVFYTIYKFEGDTLRIGDISGPFNGSSSDLRPTVVNKLVVYKNIE